MAEVRFRIEDIEDGDIFYVDGEKYVADGASYVDEDDSIGWVVYDTDGNGWYEEDIDCAVPDSDEVPEEAKVKLYDDLSIINKATGMKIHNDNDAARALDKLLKRLAAVMEQNVGQLPSLPSES